MELDYEEFENILSHTKNNEIEILRSKKCGCIFCGQILDARKINNWSNDSNVSSAICPKCGMNLVLGDASGYKIDKESVLQWHIFFVCNPDSIFEKNHEIVEKYIDLFEGKKIVLNNFAEDLYKHYLYLGVVKNNDPVSSFKIAQIYEFGTRYTKPNYNIALNYYSHPGLLYDARAIGRYGVCSYKYNKNDQFTYYSNVSKSAALDSFFGKCYLADIYTEGKVDRKDPDFAFSILSNTFFDAYRAYFFKNDTLILPDIICLGYRLGYLYEKGCGCQQNVDIALTYYLLIEKIYEQALELGETDLECEHYYKLSQSHMKKIVKEKGYTADNAILDENTFIHSMYPLSYIAQGKLQSTELEIPYMAYVGPEEFDEETKTFTFSVRYKPKKPLIVDPRRLYCEINDNVLSWKFNGVKEVYYYFENFDEAAFSKIEVGDCKMIFYIRSNQRNEPVLEIDFDRPEDETENEKGLIEA